MKTSTLSRTNIPHVGHLERDVWMLISSKYFLKYCWYIWASARVAPAMSQRGVIRRRVCVCRYDTRRHTPLHWSRYPVRQWHHSLRHATHHRDKPSYAKPRTYISSYICICRFYYTARNCGSHPQGFPWNSTSRGSILLRENYVRIE